MSKIQCADQVQHTHGNPSNFTTRSLRMGVSHIAFLGNTVHAFISQWQNLGMCDLQRTWGGHLISHIPPHQTWTAWM